MKAPLNGNGQSVLTGKESIVIKLYTDGLDGGRSLDVTNYPLTTIQAGHVIIRATTGAKDYKPMPLASGNAAYDALPANHEYAGILVATIETKIPMAAILTQGTINPNATPFPMTSILAAFKTAKPLIDWRAD